jgi:hypothetical protein
MKLLATVMLAMVCIAVPVAFGRSSVPCSMPGSWPHAADANWLARALTKAGFSSGSCTGSAFIVDLSGVAFTGQIYVWATHGPAVTHPHGPLGFGQIKRTRIAGAIVRYDRLRGLWRAKGHNVWVQTASNQPLLPVRRWTRIVRATLVTPG